MSMGFKINHRNFTILIFQTLHRSRYSAASVNHLLRGLRAELHNGTFSEETSEVKFVAVAKTYGRYYSYGGGL